MNGHQQPAPGTDGAREFARAWSTALHATVYLPLTPPERRQLLTGLTRQLAAALVAEPFDPAAGWRIGTDLVAAGFATPEALGRTIAMLTTRLAGDLHLPDTPATAARVTQLVETLASGFTTAVRDRALDAQEAIRAAALTAQARAERALRDSEAKFRHLATHDPVTDLPNRTLLTQRMRELTDRAAPGDRLAVCCLDLDRFAPVNDSLGYQVGDRLLAAVADRLRDLAAPAGWLVARLEGDQFAILAEGTTGGEDAAKLADRALSLLAEPLDIDGVQLPLTASAGVAERPAGHRDAADRPSGGRPSGGRPSGDRDAAGLIQAAQIALHWAKADGRARWRLYRHDRAATDTVRYRLSAAMPKALQRGEFTLAYQPLVDLTGGQLAGIEALARWRHPDHGLLTAGRFISLAEHTGMVVPLGNQLLAQACRQAADWHRLTADAPYLSVNVSAAQLHQPGYVGHLAQILDHTGLDPHLLQLEITEHAIIDTGEACATLGALVKLGVRIAIDDFGTGYSNLTRLRDLPLHTIKLDATFAQQAATCGEHPDAFLTTLVSLGHTLGLAVTAEGIETGNHAQRMRAAGCDTGQGWHLGRPQPAHEITRQLGNGRAP